MENTAQSADKPAIDRAIVRKYYLENDFFLSPEGILKMLSILSVTLWALAALWGGWCGARGASGGAGAALAAAALLVALSAASALLAHRAPMTRFISDITLSTVIGVSLLLVAVFSVTLCDVRRTIDYVYGPLALISSMLVIASAVMTYISVSKKWNAAPRARDSHQTVVANDLEV